MNGTFKGIDFWGTSGLAWAGMILALASASGQLHSGQVTETVVRALIWCDTDVALVVVAVWPETFGRSEITGTGKIAHCPETGPETTDVAATGQRDTGLKMATLVAELVPRLNHTGAIIKTVTWLGRELQVERAILGKGLIGIVPLRNVSAVKADGYAR